MNGNEESHLIIRQKAALYMENNTADFFDFFVSNHEHEPFSFEEALQRIRESGQWGSHADAVAIALACRIDLYIWHPPLNGCNQSLRRVLEEHRAGPWTKYVVLYDGLTHYRATNRTSPVTVAPTITGKIFNRLRV
jgi:hypothetical protein